MNKVARAILLFSCASMAYASDVPVVRDVGTPTPVSEFSESIDLDSYDPNSTENQDLLDRGLGFPIAARAGTGKTAMVMSSSIGLEFEAPLGWRGFDDGEKTRLFAPGGDIGLIIGIADRPADFDEYRAQQISHIASMIERSNTYRPTFIDSPDVFGLIERHVPDPMESYSSIVVYIDHPARNDVKIRLNLFSPVERFDAMVGLVASTVENLRSHRSIE